MKTLHQGSCHCGAVRFQCELDLETETSRCNCSICTKQRFWKSVIPSSDLEILSGEANLSAYQFGKRSIHHYFCRTCGTKPFGRGHMEPIGSFYAVNVACLDDVSDAQWANAPVTYQDGRHDHWERAPEETRYL